MILPPFRLHRPTSLAEAVEVLRGLPPGSVDVLAGGTDLLPNYKQRLNPRPHLLSLDRIGELTRLGERTLGAGVTLETLAGDPGWRARFPGLTEAAGGIASPPLRRVATCGGNLLVENRCFWFNQFYDWRLAEGFCMKADGPTCRVIDSDERCVAVYPGELAPNLMVLGATLRLLGPGGERRVPVRDFFAGDGIARNRRQPGELLVEIELPASGLPTRTGYAKLAVRGSVDFAEAGVAAGLDLAGGKVTRLELAATALDTVPLRFPELAAALAGRVPDAGWYQELKAGVSAGVAPMKNTFLSPEYRRKMAGVLAQRVVRRLVEAGA